MNRENARERASITDGENNNLRREKGSSSLIDHPPLSGGGERQETSKRNCAKEDDVLTSDIVLISGHSLSDDTDANDVIIEPHDFTRIASVDDENFEDEFDPILASIRKPPQTSATASAPSSTGKSSSDATIAGTGICDAPTVEEKKSDSRGSPNVGANFAAGLLSVFPEDMRARAGDMMVESSLRLSKSAGALRSALESGVPFVGNRSKRQREVDDGIELEDGRTGASSSRRTMGGRKDEDEENVRMLNVNEVLNEEEVRKIGRFIEASVTKEDRRSSRMPEIPTIYTPYTTDIRLVDLVRVLCRCAFLGFRSGNNSPHCLGGQEQRVGISLGVDDSANTCPLLQVRV